MLKLSSLGGVPVTPKAEFLPQKTLMAENITSTNMTSAKPSSSEPNSYRDDHKLASNIIKEHWPDSSKQTYSADFPIDKRNTPKIINPTGFAAPATHNKFAGLSHRLSDNLNALDLAGEIKPSVFSESEVINKKFTKESPQNIKKCMDIFSSNSNKRSLPGNFNIIYDTKNCMAVRIHPLESRQNDYSRIVLMINDQRFSAEAKIFAENFGALDVILCSRNNRAVLPLSIADEKDFKLLRNSDIAKISLFLTGGQRINIDNLSKNLGLNVKIDGPLTTNSENERVHEKALRNFFKMKNEAPNGKVMNAPFGDEKRFKVLHQTSKTAYDGIVKGKEINVSKSGCLGPAIYGTSTLGNSFAGGHTLAMAKRAAIVRGVDQKYKKKQLNAEEINKLRENINQQRKELRDPSPYNLLTDSKESSYLLFDIENNSVNNLTNWIERFGNGVTYLEAQIRMENDLNISAERVKTETDLHENSAVKSPISQKISGDESVAINSVKNKCIENYNNLYKFFDTVYRIQMEHDNFDDSAAFDKTWNSFESARNKSPTLLNNVLFEAVKDYILLYSSGEKTQELTNLQSFDMDHQYKIIFDLFPDMLTNWDTVKFKPTLKTLTETLRKYDGKFNGNTFKAFLIEAMSFYVTNRLFNGSAPTNPNHLSDFTGLAKAHPNLSGILYHYIAAGDFKGQPFFEKHLGYVNECENDSAKVSKNLVTIKAGMFGTEEVGIKFGTKAIIADAKFSKVSESTNVKITQGNELDITISKETSNNSGFTHRTVLGGQR